MNSVDLFDRALTGALKDAPATIRALTATAREVADAISAPRLDSEERARIFARSLTMLESALDDNRRGWQRVLRLERPAPVLVGGSAAVALALGAAIGWALLHGRRSPARVGAGVAAGAALR